MIPIEQHATCTETLAAILMIQKYSIWQIIQRYVSNAIKGYTTTLYRGLLNLLQVEAHVLGYYFLQVKDSKLGYFLQLCMTQVEF